MCVYISEAESQELVCLRGHSPEMEPGLSGKKGRALEALRNSFGKESL